VADPRNSALSERWVPWRSSHNERGRRSIHCDVHRVMGAVGQSQCHKDQQLRGFVTVGTVIMLLLALQASTGHLYAIETSSDDWQTCNYDLDGETWVLEVFIDEICPATIRIIW
jgi:hypothetical protein